MQNKASAALRKSFLDFFAAHDHAIVKSSSLIPANDPTLMFVNAGMVQFKEVFVGLESRPYSRAVTCQKCMRVSGKHNDLEEVGRTARHHTFFEMLGNFSFGDYFKEQAIEYAWKYITREVGLNPNKLWVTVFGGAEGIAADTEARMLWKKISGLPDSRILDLGMKDNFWAMGDSGPCGPCSEIHYDQAPDSAPAPTLHDFESGRVVEIWNNVFMQFNRQAGVLTPLPAPSVDTGMGLERLAAIVQGQNSNYHSDLFLPLIQTIADAAGKTYHRSDSEDDVSIRVIADHARSTAFLVAEGVQPSNEGRGYVLRRLMRRAIRHGKRLGFDDIFFDRMCQRVVEMMSPVYPELRESQAFIGKVAQLEEDNFRRTLDTGLGILEQAIETVVTAKQSMLPGDVVFRLYDTYGFPKDLTEVIAQEKGLSVDAAGFDTAMEAQRERSRGGDVGDAAVATVYKTVAHRVGNVAYAGYPHEDQPLAAREGTWRLERVQGRNYLQLQTRVVALICDGVEVQEAHARVGVDAEHAARVDVVLDPTPFYGESGGQAGDQGVIVGAVDASQAQPPSDADGDLVIDVRDTIKPIDTMPVACGRLLRGHVHVGQTVWAGVDPIVRKETRAHHSATHLLHAALRQVLGEHVKQAGSLVDGTHLRFDYAHFEAPTPAQLRAVEDDVNRRIQAGSDVSTQVMSFDDAKQHGAIALFGEKYGDTVRVVTMGGSVELCGGTHAHNTKDIGMLVIMREEAVSSGVRRIEAEVSDAARASTRLTALRLQQAAQILNHVAPEHAAVADREPDLDQNDMPRYDDQPILHAVAKAVRQMENLAAQVKAAGGEPVLVTRNAQAPVLHDNFGLAEARAVRDVWLGLVQLANARAAEADAIAAHYDAVDQGGLLRTMAAVQKARRDNERRAAEVASGGLSALAHDLLAQCREVGGINVLAARVPGSMDGGMLKNLVDHVRPQLGSGVMCLGAQDDAQKVALVVAVTRDLTDRFQAGNLVKALAPLIDGRGGGKPELAQAGGTRPEGLSAAFESLLTLIAK